MIFTSCIIYILLYLPVAASILCYECFANNNDTERLCDSSFIKMASKIDKANITLHCMDDYDFCLKKVIFDGKFAQTFRGCIGDYDIFGNKMRNGCHTHKLNDKKVIFCLCSTDLCNTASNNKMTKPLFMVILNIFQIVYYYYSNRI